MLKNKERLGRAILVIVGLLMFSSLLLFLSRESRPLMNECTEPDEIMKDDDEDHHDFDAVSFIPRGIRLTFIHDFNESVVISWYTLQKASDPKIRYSSSSKLSSSLEVMPLSMVISSSVIYIAELRDLTPNTAYYYQVSSDDSHEREIMNFMTLGSNDNNRVKFLVYGDSQTERGVRRRLIEKIMREFRNDFDFTVALGDMTVEGKIQSFWDDFFDDLEKINAYKQGLYVEGDHEGGLSTKMYDNLFMTNNESNRYYSFSYGGMGFIILNSNKEAVDDDVQTEWLEQALIRSSEENKFTLIFMHHPLLHDRSYQYHREKWCLLFDEYNVTCIFAGHNHHYERSHPMKNSTSLEFDDSELYDHVNITDPIYFVSGGAGGPVYAPEIHDFVAKNASTNHVLLVDVEHDSIESKISIEMWMMGDVSAHALVLADNITITKRAL